MNLLLTGASGFVGKNLLLRAPAHWRITAVYCHDEEFPAFVARLNRPHMQAVQCDLTDPGQVARLCARHGQDWDACLYLAAKVDIPWSVRAPKLDLQTNAGALLTLLERLRCDRLVYFSSGAIYDGHKGQVRPDTPCSPTLPYAISKQVSERYVEFFHRRAQSVGRFLIVRFFGAYGPYEPPHKIYTKLIRNFAIERRDAYTLYGSGKNLIDAMHVDDTVDAVTRMVDGGYWNKTVNLAGGNPVSIEALVRSVATHLGVAGARVEKEGVAHEDNLFWGSVDEMREYWDFIPKVTLAEGIVRFRAFLTGSAAHA